MRPKQTEHISIIQRIRYVSEWKIFISRHSSIIISYTKRCIIVMGLVITVKARFGTYFEYYWSFHEKIEILEFEYEF